MSLLDIGQNQIVGNTDVDSQVPPYIHYHHVPVAKVPKKECEDDEHPLRA